MPFVENLDMDRFSATARQNASNRAVVVKTPLTDCGSLEAAQSRLAGILYTASGKRSAQYQRMVKMAVRFTRNAETAYDLISNAYMSTALAWDRVTDAEGYMFRSVRNNAMMLRRRSDIKAEQLSGDMEALAVLQAETVAESYQPVADGAVRSLDMLWEQATKIERKIIDTVFVQDSFNGLQQYTTLEAIAGKLGMTEATLKNHLKRLGVRAGVWTNEKRWFRQGAGSRRSQWFMRASCAKHVWSVLGWYGFKSADYNLWMLGEWHKWTMDHVGELFAEMEKEHTGV